GAVLASAVLGSLGLKVYPEWHEERGDIVQTVQLTDLQQLEAFVRTVQASSPVDSHVLPEFAYMPGYEDDIIMAAGTFVQGASIELSCDAPRRPPFLAFLQGGLTYQHTRYVVGELVKLLQDSQ
ncbi:MAG: methionine gamma-lyase family protein, partial [Bacillota bacterium]